MPVRWTRRRALESTDGLDMITVAVKREYSGFRGLVRKNRLKCPYFVYWKLMLANRALQLNARTRAPRFSDPSLEVIISLNPPFHRIGWDVGLDRIGHRAYGKGRSRI